MGQSLFIQMHSRAIRCWHWTTFIITGLILFTVAVDKTFLNRFQAVPIIEESLHNAGLAITQDQAFQLAGDLGNNVWKWHIRYGYVLSGLFVFRIVIEFFQLRRQRFIYRMKNAISFTKIKTERKPAFHYLFTRMIYLLFYILLGTITGTGLWLSFHRPPANVEQFHAVKEIHESCFLFLLLFIFIHIGGVIMAERKHHRNLVSGMIHGGREWEVIHNENSI